MAAPAIASWSSLVGLPSQLIASAFNALINFNTSGNNATNIGTGTYSGAIIIGNSSGPSTTSLAGTVTLPRTAAIGTGLVSKTAGGTVGWAAGATQKAGSELFLSTSTSTAVGANFVASGFGTTFTFTPSTTGTLFLKMSSTVWSTTTTDGGQISLYYGTGAAPGAGVNIESYGGTVARIILSPIMVFTAVTFTPTSQYTSSAVLSGLTLSTALWFDFGLKRVTGGTFNCQNSFLYIDEI